MSESESKNENENANESESESESNNNDYEKYQDHKIKQLNNYFKTIKETKSFEEQIELLKKEIIQMNIGMRDIIMVIKN